MENYYPDEPSTERISDEYLTLNSCGIQELCVADRSCVRHSGRVDYHILYIGKGVCYLTLDGAETEAPAGSLILFRPGEPQIYSFRACDNSVSHYIHFTGKGCEALLRSLGIYGIRVFSMGVSRSYEELSAKMAREYTMKREFSGSWCAAYLHGLLNIIARKYALRHSRISYTSESRINYACREIYARLANPPDLHELASKCCLSDSRFTHLFREVTGKSLLEFTLSMRVERAKQLLSATDMSVHEVAEAVGYSDQNYFSRIFKRVSGLSPREFRNGC